MNKTISSHNPSLANFSVSQEFSRPSRLGSLLERIRNVAIACLKIIAALFCFFGCCSRFKSRSTEDMPTSNPAAPILSQPSISSSPAKDRVTFNQAAHILSYPGIIGRYVNNEKLEGSHPTCIYRKIEAAICQAVKEGAPPPSPAFQKAFDQILDLCSYAETLKASGSGPIENQAEKFAAEIQRRLTDLPVGETYTVYGGWVGRKGANGHAMLYKFEKTHADKFTVTIYNSGSGIDEFHPSTTKNGKERYALSLPFKDIPASNVLGKEFWCAFFQTTHGKNDGTPFDASYLYTQLFPCLIPDFKKRFGGDQNLAQITFRKSQVGGVCTAQALFTLLRESVGENYSFLRDKVRVIILKEQQEALKEDHILHTQGERPEDTNLSRLSARKGILRHFQGELQRVAGDITRSVTKHFAEQSSAQKDLETIKTIAKEITDTQSYLSEQCRLIRPLVIKDESFSPNISLPDPGPLTLPTPSRNPLPLLGAPICFGKPLWPSEIGSFKLQLESWIKEIHAAFQKGNQADASIYAYVQEILRSMPSIKDERWNSLSKEHRLACIEHLNTLSSYLVRTHFTQSERLFSQRTVEACLTKASALICQLCLQSEPLLGSGGFADILPFGYYNARKYAGFFLTDPILDQDYLDSCDSLKRLRRGWFEDSRILSHDGLKILPEMVSKVNFKFHSEVYKFHSEVYLINYYLSQETQAPIVAKIEENLSTQFKKSIKKESHWTFIIGEALANPRKYFPDMPFWAMQDQAFLMQMVRRPPKDFWIESLVKGQARNEPLITLKLAGDDIYNIPYTSSSLRPWIRLPWRERDGYRSGGEGYEFSLGEAPKNPYPSPDLSTALDEVCSGWYQPKSDPRNLLLKNGLSDAVKEAPAEIQELVPLIWGTDPKHQAMKVIAYYRSHMALLKQPIHQWVLKSCLFYPGALNEQLKHGAFIDTLAQFLHYGWMQSKKDLQTALFFAHLSDKVKAFCYQVSPKQTGAQNFPTIDLIWKSLEEQIQKNEDTTAHKQSDQALVSATVLAHYSTNPTIWEQSPQDLLLHALRYGTHQTLCQQILSPEQIEDANTGYTALVRFIKNQFDKNPLQCKELIAHAVANYLGKKELHQMEWFGFKDSFPILYTKNHEYQLDLLSGQLWTQEKQLGMFPQAILKDNTFKQLFLNFSELSDVSSTPNSAFFKDKQGVPHQAWIENDDVHYARFIEGTWYHYHPKKTEMLARDIPLFSLLFDSWTTWSANIKGDIQTLVFDQQTRNPLYRHSEKTKSLEWIQSQGAKRLFAILPGAKNEIKLFFEKMDPKVQLWGDAQGRISTIQLPSYPLIFDVEYPHNGEPIITSRDHPGYRVAAQQFLPQLLQAEKGHLILTKGDPTLPEEEQDRMLLLAKNDLHAEPNFVCGPLGREVYSYYTYQISPKGEIENRTNLEARLYLAYLYTLLGEYQRAEKLLYPPYESTPTERYSPEAFKWLLNIIRGTSTGRGEESVDQNTQAAAIRLKALRLGRENLEEWQNREEEQHDPSIQKIRQEFQKLEKLSFKDRYNCRQQQSRLPKELLSPILPLETSAQTTEIEKKEKSDSLNESFLLSEAYKIFNDNYSHDCANFFNTYRLNHWNTWNADTINPNILKDTPLDIEPSDSQLQAQFLHFYAIAYDRTDTPLARANRESLKLRMQLIHNVIGKFFAKILLRCLDADESTLQKVWPSPSTLQKLMQHKDYNSSNDLSATLIQLFQQQCLIYDLAHPEENPAQQSASRPPIKEREAKISAEAPPPAKKPISSSPEQQTLIQTLGEEAVHKLTGWLTTLSLFNPITPPAEQENASWNAVAERLEPDQKEARDNALKEYAKQETRAVFKDNDYSPEPRQIVQFAALATTKEQLDKELQDLKPLLKALRQKMRTLAAKLPPDRQGIAQESALIAGSQRPLNFQKMLLCYLKKDATVYRQYNPALSDADCQQLHAWTEEYLVNASWQKQLMRSKKLVLKLEKIPPSERMQKKSEILGQKLYDTLSAKRIFIPEEHPEYLLFEYASDLILRKEQIAQIEMLIDKKQWSILEILMGSGKTEVLLTLILLKMADGESIPTAILPETLLQNFAPQISRKAGSLFGQEVVRINWKGTSRFGLNLKELQQLRGRLEAIPKQGSFLLASHLDMHRLVLQAKKTKIELTKTGDKETLGKWREFKTILYLLKTRSHWLMDEVDLTLRPDFEMHQALDSGSPIDPTRTEIGRLLYENLFTSFPKISFDCHPQPGQEPFTNLLYETTIKSKLKKVMLEQLMTKPQFIDFAKEIGANQAAITRYLDHPKVDLPSSMSPELKDMLAFLRFEINTLLPLTLNKLHGQNYGRFPEKEGMQSVLAGPYQYKDAPCIGSQFGMYGEQINYTLQTYVKEGLSVQDLQKEILRLQNDLERTLAVQGGNPEDTAAYQEYRTNYDPAGKYKLMQLQPAQIQALAKELSTDIPRLLQFVHRLLDRTIRIPSEQITSTPQQIMGLCASAKGMSGTVFATRKTFPKKFDQIVTAKGIHRREINCLQRNNTLHILSSKFSGTAFIDALFKEDPAGKIKAIIDVGALLTNASMREFAEHILKVRPKMQAVIYYENDTPWVLQRDHDPLPYTAEFDEQIDPANRFTLYDQKRCTGANILQDPEAEAFVTLHKTQTFRDLTQGVWRMRGIEKGQQVHIVTNDEIHNIMRSELGKPDGTKLDVVDTIDYTLRNQASLQAKNGVKLVKQELRALFEETCEEIVNKVPDTEWHQEPIRSLILLSVTEVKDNPYAQFGRPEEEAQASDVLGDYGRQLLSKIQAWHEKRKKETRDLDVENILKKANGQLTTIVKQALDQEVVPQTLPKQQGVEFDQEVAITMEVEQENETDIEQNQMQNPYGSQAEINLDWPTGNELCYKGYIQAYSIPPKKRENFSIKNYLDDRFENGHLKCPVIYANDILKLNPAANDLLQEATPFNSNLQVSLNLAFVEKGGKAFSPLHQLQRSRCLINQGPQGVQLLLLSPSDAESMLDGNPYPLDQVLKNHPYALYDYTLGPGEAGIYAKGKDGFDWDKLSADPNFKELFVQYKFFCGELNSYTPEECVLLKQWLQKMPAADRIKFIKSFKEVLLTSNKLRTEYPSSVACKCFKDLALLGHGCEIGVSPPPLNIITSTQGSVVLPRPPSPVAGVSKGAIKHAKIEKVFHTVIDKLSVKSISLS